MSPFRPATPLAVVILLAAACVPDGQQTTGPGGPSFGRRSGSSGSTSSGSPWTDAAHFVVEYAGTAKQLSAAVAAVGGTVDRIHPEINVAKVSGIDDQRAARLGSAPGVISVTRDVVARFVPSAAAARTQGALDRTGARPQTHRDPSQAIRFQAWQWNMRAIHADQAWPTGIQGQGARVAILDTGIDDTHPELTGCVDRASSTAFTPNQNTTGGFPAWGDDYFHGTWVASQICTNARVLASVAPHATLIAVKVLDKDGSGSFADIIAGVLYAANLRVNVINMSLGGYFPRGHTGLGRLNALLAKVDNYAASQGVLVVAAAGNDGANLDNDRDSIFVPAQSGSTTPVSATGPIGQQNFDRLAGYSNYGRSGVAVAAPGGDFVPPGGVLLDLLVGACSKQTLQPGLAVCRSTAEDFYIFALGTSGAAPHASGVAALVSSRFGNGLNGGQLRTRLEQSSDDLGAPGTDLFYSHGRINAFRAVTR